VVKHNFLTQEKSPAKADLVRDTALRALGPNLYTRDDVVVGGENKVMAEIDAKFGIAITAFLRSGLRPEWFDENREEEFEQVLNLTANGTRS
jgi:hypothetical protein